MLRLLINLDRSPDRLKFMQKELSSLGVQYERVIAIDGQELSNEEIQSLTPYQYSKTKLWFPYKLSKAEYACFLSHRKCWKKLIESSEEYALILEDDIKFIPEATAFFKNSDWIPNDVHLIQLHAPLLPQLFQVKNLTIPIKGTPSHSLYEVVHPTANGTPAYIISKTAAKIALSNSLQIAAPIDEFLFSPKSPIRRLINFYKLDPGLGYQIDIPSTIVTSPRNRHKPFLCRVHPFSIWLKCHTLYLKFTYTKTKTFKTTSK